MIQEKSLINKANYLFALTVLIAVLISAFLHFWQIGENPPGLFIDEASLSYNAYALAQTGGDEYGYKFPLFFKCFGYYNDPVMVYTLVPFVKFFGFTKTVCRFPSGIYHLLAAFGFFLLAFMYSRNRWISLVGAFIFSLIPWVFPLSRSIIGGYTPMLMGMIFGWYFLIKSLAKQSYCLAILAGLSWAFAMYSHNIGRPMSAFFLILFVLCFNFRLLKRWKVFLTFTLSYVIVLIPMVISVASRSESMTNRFNSIAVWGDKPTFAVLLTRLISRYFDYFNPMFLLVTGDSNPRHNTGNSGQLFFFLVPFILLGLYILIRYFKRNPYYRFALIGLLAFPAAAILTMGRFHGTRTMHASIFWCITAVVGLKYAWEKRKKIKPLLWVVALIGIFEISTYFHFYFTQYPKNSRTAFGANLNDALLFAAENIKDDETIYISSTAFLTDRVNKQFKPFWYANILFMNQVKPELYQKKQEIPSSQVSPYEGSIARNGILITSDMKVFFNKERKIVGLIPNNEKIPTGSEILCSFKDQGRNLMVYRVIKNKLE